MRKIVTEWIEADKLVLTPDVSHAGPSQPSIGIEFCWNIPRQWWKPYVIFHLWHTHYQIGWLADHK